MTISSVSKPLVDHTAILLQKRCPSPEIDVACLGLKENQRLSTIKRCSSVNSSSRRRVRFNTEVIIRETIHINDLMDEEYEQCWYAPEDFTLMKEEFAGTIKFLARGLPIPEGETSRGLEYRHSKGAKARKRNKSLGFAAVLDEQERQRIIGVQDDSMISRLYKETADPCLITAHKRGLKDAAEVHGDQAPSLFAMKWSDI